MTARGWFAAALVGSLLAAVLVAGPASAAPAPVVTVTPAADLLDGQTVHVSISGAQPSSETFTMQCTAGATGQAQCNPATNRGATLDSQGALEFDFGLEAVFTPSGASAVDCRVPNRCELLTYLFAVDGSVAIVHTPLPFRPDGPLLPRPTITVTPSIDLVDGDNAQVVGSGYPFEVGLGLVQCRAGFTRIEDCESAHTFVGTKIDGTFAQEVDLSAIVITTGGARLDCRVGACVLAAIRPLITPLEPRQVASVPLSFRPDGPLRAPPVLTVSPAEGLVSGQHVQVSGSGFRPGTVVVSQCRAAVPLDPGSAVQRCEGFTFVSVDASGVLAPQTLIAAAFLQTQSGFSDCRVAPGCTVAGLDVDTTSSLVEVPISFDPSGPGPVYPTLTVEPAGPLPARSLVTVRGQGFPPSSSVSLRQCRLEHGAPGDCPAAGDNSSPVDANGGLVGQKLVTAVIAGPNGTDIDCRRVTCGVVAESLGRIPAVGVLTFATSAPQHHPGHHGHDHHGHDQHGHDHHGHDHHPGR